MNRFRYMLLHAVILCFATLTLIPFVFALNNSFRTSTELYHGFFGVPRAFKEAAAALGSVMTGDEQAIEVTEIDGTTYPLPPREALRFNVALGFANYRNAWRNIRPYVVNSLFVCTVTAIGVMLLASITAYVLSRQKFFGSRVVYYFIISTMMFPGVLTFVPAFLLVKNFGLLNTYWAMVLPYVAGGQVFAIFVLKGFFDGLPEDLFEAARIDGAGHLQSYWHIVVPLSKPVLSVVLIMNLLGTWNNFMWPFVTQPDGRYHVIASGLYVLATSAHAQDSATLLAAYMLSSIPLLLLFIYATRPFIRGVTSGAFKA